MWERRNAHVIAVSALAWLGLAAPGLAAESTIAGTGAVAASIPPSTSTSHAGWSRSMSSRTRAIFGRVVRRNC